MLNTLVSFMHRSYDGAPYWAFAFIGALLVFEFLLGKFHPKSKSTIALVGAALKLVAYGVSWVLAKFPPTALVGEFLKSLFAATLLVCVMCGVSGCATAGMPKNATFTEKVTADAGVLNAIKNDIVGKCPKLAPLAPLVAKALAVASDPYNVLNDVMTALAAIPELKQDYDAIKCAVQTVLDDYKLYFKTQPTVKTAQSIRTLERVLAILDEESHGAFIPVCQ